MPETLNHAIVLDGDIPDSIANRAVILAHGSNERDMNFINKTYSVFDLCVMLSKFERGVKDGKCVLMGAVVPAPSGARGTDRKAHNMTANYVVMVDFDEGDSPEEVIAKAKQLGLFAVVWTTHSHAREFFPVSEKAVIESLKKKGTPTDSPTPEQVIEFVEQHVKIYPKYKDNLQVVGREIIIGGAHFMCKLTSPLPKCRALFVLDNKFDFANRGGTHAQAMTEWVERYAGFCEKTLGMASWDHACSDPSRLMYLPRISPDTDITQHSITVVPGTLLDFEGVPRVQKAKDTRKPTLPAQGLPGFVSNPNQTTAAATDARADAAAAGDPSALKTSWLPRFLKDHAHDFEVEDWLKSVADPDRALQCPWADLHSHMTSEDKGFKAWNASLKDGDGGFGLQCSHNGCRTDLARGMRADGKQDRAKYLDALILQHGATVAQLLEFCPHAEEEDAAREAEKAAARGTQATLLASGDDDAANEARVRSFTEETSWEDVQGMCRLLAVRPEKETGRVNQLVKLMSQQTVFGKKALDDTVKALQREAVQQARTLAAEEAPALDDPTMTPPGDLSAYVPLWPSLNEAWTEKIVQLSALRQVERFNRELPTPRLFNRAEGGTMRADRRSSDGKLLVDEVSKDAWMYEIGNVVQFKKAGLNGRKHMPTPGSVISYIVGAPNRDFPMLERVVKVPLFSEEGTLITQPGYDVGTKCYLDPDFTPLPVEMPPSPTSLNMALDLIDEALTDFAFTDVFNGDDELPIKSDDKDKDGHPIANFERGQASRANMMALILQPFVQHLIKGSCPAYHLDKAAPGSGAGYLTDVAFIIAQGTRAVVNTMSDNNEEFKKSITATLRQGSPIIFIDNINRKVDSGALAAALTSGVWQDRILGVSENARIEVKCAWVMAGNNLSFSPELMRRNVPIRLDTKLVNPALDRPKETFKHHPMQDWLQEMRPALVWACLTIVAHWFACGRPVGSVTMNSFDHWAAIMGGILESCGVAGFLSNIPAYLATKNDDDIGVSHFVQALWEQFEDKEFTAAMALAATKDPFGNVQFGIPIDTDKNERSQLKWWGDYIKSTLGGGRTYRVGTPPRNDLRGSWVPGPEDSFLVSWITNESGNNKKHRLKRNVTRSKR